jgi:signal peptidase I
MSDETTTATEPAASHGAHRKESSGGSFFRELPFVLALLIKAFLIQAFYIPSGSMQHTLELRDRVLVNKVIYHFRDIHRGEIVVFNGLDNFTSESQIPPPRNGLQRVLRSISGAVGVGAPSERDFIKRVIGVPGDRVACCTNGNVTVQPPGGAPVELNEPYLFENDQPQVFCDAGSGAEKCPAGAPGVLVPKGRLWVMGDHRGQSADSRSHITDSNHGTVPIDKVIGRAFVIVWPVGRASVLHVPSTFKNSGLVVAAGAGLTATPYALGFLGAFPVRGLGRRLRRRR